VQAISPQPFAFIGRRHEKTEEIAFVGLLMKVAPPAYLAT
jgi:hypothetical protein